MTSRLPHLLLFGLWVISQLGLFAGSADYEAHIADLKKHVPDEFTLVEVSPFIVVTDQTDQALNLSVFTVRWIVQHLKKDFFAKDPAEIIDIWLFKNQASYKKYTWELFQEEPANPFGYSSPQNHALLISIVQGSGALVHEIVHPFMRANFPACPPWFDEGLASLFEQSTDRKGHLVGEVNWSLPGLQETIRSGETLTFQQLTTLNAEEFHRGDSAAENHPYSIQARYLCYYLQEQDLLVKYYREFASNAATDPSGYATLQHVLGVEDMAAFQKKWAQFILDLKLKSKT